MKVHLPVIVQNISTKADRSIKIVLETRELPPNEMTTLFELRNTEAWAILAGSELSTSDIPEYKPDPGLNQKSPSQRMRGLLYRIWEKNGKQGEFETYYAAKMERFVDQLKEVLNES